MPFTWDEIRGNALRFANRWKNASNEEAQAQTFQTAFLSVFGVDDPESIGDFEYKAPLEEGRTGYIDYLWKERIATYNDDPIAFQWTAKADKNNRKSSSC